MKSYDLNQKGLQFVSRSQITLLLSLDSLKFRFENIILAVFLPRFKFSLPCSWFKGQPSYRYVLERVYQGRKQNIKEAYRESFYCAGSLSLNWIVFIIFVPGILALCINEVMPLASSIKIYILERHRYLEKTHSFDQSMSLTRSGQLNKNFSFK